MNMTSLNDILLKYPNIKIANEGNDQNILNFFKNIKMETRDLNLRYERGPSFFSFCKRQSSEFFVFILLNDDQSIQGVGSIIILNHLINGERQKCAYLGDLRISPILKLSIRIQWKKFYTEIIQNKSHIQELHQVHSFYTAVLAENLKALNALTKNNDQLIYHHLTNYETVSILFHKRWKTIFQKNDFPQKAALSDILEFITTRQDKLLSSDRSEINFRLNHWENLQADSFDVYKNSSGEIIFSCAPQIINEKKMVISSLKFKHHLLSLILKIMGLPLIKNNSEIKILYLTHLHFSPKLNQIERTKIMQHYLNYILSKKRDFCLI